MAKPVKIGKAKIFFWGAGALSFRIQHHSRNVDLKFLFYMTITVELLKVLLGVLPKYFNSVPGTTTLLKLKTKLKNI